uniref:Uncharacterized protein n=1 Tax=Anguilla anguilla TaxID=7936 RepID=A0A0E9Q210_ANGAN
MIGQKTINSFFSPVGTKRTLEANKQDTKEKAENNVSQVKKLKPTSDMPPTVTTLSPEQLDKIEKSKRVALERLAAHNAPDGFGESWRKELNAEFGKPYLKD